MSEAEVKEAAQYWGYLISADRTGTDKLRNLLHGLYTLIGSTYETYDSSDLTPIQLSHFYHACNGQFDALFLDTPSPALAKIYKTLGCSHSLQPLPVPSTEPKYSDPVIPALKVEGWIVWFTIQLLLNPDIHSEFLMQAVKKWDVKVPGTNDVFPKTLPRSCFPSAPDPGMERWYYGQYERMRREVEDEEHMRVKAVDARPDSPVLKHHRLREARHTNSSDEESPEDTRSSALAYFSNPLFRTVDGRSGLIRRASKRPQLSPRHSFVQRGKTAAATVGRVVQNVASPHLWDGHATKHTGDHHHRRKSLPDKHRHEDEDHTKHEHSYWNSGADSPRRTHSMRSHGTSPDPSHQRNHSAAREYFPPPSNYDGQASYSRRNSATHLDPRSAAAASASASTTQSNSSGYGPSVSPLFATHVARGEAPTYPYRSSSRPPLQTRSDYRSPERAMPSSRPNSGREREDWEGSDSAGSGVGRAPSLRQKSRHGTPVSFGVEARRYAAPPTGEVPYRRRE